MTTVELHSSCQQCLDNDTVGPFCEQCQDALGLLQAYSNRPF